jgi:hypothetical protein
MSSPTLRDLQHDFSDWVTGAPNGRIEAYVEARGLTSGARLGVYRNMVFNNLTEALATAYPVVKALVGDEFFEVIAARYITQYPSGCGNLQRYGLHFAKLLAAAPDAAHLEYLPDVARLEWARQESALAPLAAPIEPTELSSLPPGTEHRLRFTLHPSIRMITSNFPVLEIWLYCQSPGDSRLELDHGQNVAIWRSGEQIAMQAFESSDHEFVVALQRGAMLSEAHAAASGETPFDPAELLQRLFAEGLVVGARY